MKVKALFSEYWFTNDKGQKMYKTHFYITSETVAWVTTKKMYQYGEELVLSAGRDSNTGKAVLKLAQ